MVISEGISKEFLSIHFDHRRCEMKRTSPSFSPIRGRPTGFYYKDVPLSMARRRLILRTYPSLSNAVCRVALSTPLGSMLPYWLGDYGLEDIVRIDDPHLADEEFVDFKGMRYTLGTTSYRYAIGLIGCVPNLSLIRIIPSGSDKKLCYQLDHLINLERMRKPGQKITAEDLERKGCLSAPAAIR
jgi:hypothetical protein